MANLDFDAGAESAEFVRVSLHRELTDRLRDMIVEGRLAPGEKVPEKELCLRLGVSRTPLRESLKVLAAEGLVRLAPNRGATVARLTRGELVEIFSVLGALEGLAGALACARIGASDIARLDALQAEMVAFYESGDLPAYFKRNQAVHALIIDVADNAALRAVHNSLSLRIRRYRYAANLSKGRWREAIEEHQSILNALTARDAPQAARLMQAHFERKLSAALLQIDAEPGAE